MAKTIQLEFDDLSFRSEKTQGPVLENKPETKPANPDIVRELKKKGGGRRSLKEPVNKAIALPPDKELFEKTYYSIGEVAKMFGEQVSLIRFWANEFKILKPRKNRKGDRYFPPEDVKNLYLIYNLLRVRKFTIEGAKDFLKNQKSALEKYELIESLKELKLFLQQLKDNL